MANAERCVCCGEIIPEGRMVCPNCEVAGKAKENGLKDFLEQHGLVLRKLKTCWMRRKGNEYG